MSRLTERQSAGYDLVKMKGAWCGNYCEQQSKATCRDCAIWEAIQKLAHYEDMEEAGRLIKYDTNQYGVMKMPKSNATLKAMTKVELIEYIRILEHDYNVAVDFNERQARNIEAKLKELEGDKE